MKRIFFLPLVLLVFTAGAQNPTAVKAADADMPYKARLSTKFSIGSSQFSRTILNAWKDWDNNTLDNIAPLLADNVRAVFPDGSVIEGKANFMKEAKAYRAGYTSVKSEVISYTTLKIDESDNEHVVLIWGDETSTKKDGTVSKNALHEVWLFNKDGQITYVQQWMGKVPEEK